MRHSLFVCLLLSLLGTASARAQEKSAEDDNYDPSVAAMYASQVRLQTPAMSTRPTSTRSQSSSSSLSSYVRLARAPNMFGDSIFVGGKFDNKGRTKGSITSEVPLGGGGGSFKVGENSKPIPMDRVYFNYNGYQNALAYSSVTVGPPVTTAANLNQYTMGFEKTFLDGFWSVDVRMPIYDGFRTSFNSFSIDSGEYGNISAFLKHLFYQDDTLALAYGCGVGLPTGSNLDVVLDNAPYTIQNEAIHLMPYVGFFAQPSEDWFYQGFFQIDFAANGNEVVIDQPGRSAGRLNEQNLMYADLSLGRWLYRNPDSTYFQGFAGVIELHYTTTIQDTDVVRFRNARDPSFTTLSNTANRVDVLNLTAGLHWQITELSNLRVGCVTPLRTGFDRQFDAEIQASFNRYF